MSKRPTPGREGGPEGWVRRARPGFSVQLLVECSDGVRLQWIVMPWLLVVLVKYWNPGNSFDLGAQQGRHGDQCTGSISLVDYVSADNLKARHQLHTLGAPSRAECTPTL